MNASDLGHQATALAFRCLATAAAIGPRHAVRARRVAAVGAVAASIAVAVLARALVWRDYRLSYVAEVVARSASRPYRLAGLWAAMAGSLLLHAAMAAVAVALGSIGVARRHAGSPPPEGTPLAGRLMLVHVVLVAVTAVVVLVGTLWPIVGHWSDDRRRAVDPRFFTAAVTPLAVLATVGSTVAALRLARPRRRRAGATRWSLIAGHLGLVLLVSSSIASSFGAARCARAAVHPMGVDRRPGDPRRVPRIVRLCGAPPRQTVGVHAGVNDQVSTAAVGWTTFPTALGPCAVAWSAKGLVGVALPEPSEATMAWRAARRWPATPCIDGAPEPVAKAIAAMTALIAGQAADLTGVAVDLAAVSAFDARVYEAAREVGPGQTITYGELTRRIGEDTAVARAVGQSLGRNPVPIVVPCHRIVATGGGLGGFSATGGTLTKRRLLAIEGAAVVPPSLFD